jgi:hypothetical protein
VFATIHAPQPDWEGAGLRPWASAEYERVVTVARIVQETNLAWALAEAIKPHLSTLERNHVFAAIGAGDAFPAIRYLFKSVAIKRIPLRPDLVQQCTTWLHAYVGHNDERYLRSLIEDYLVPYSMNLPATVRVSRLPTTSKPGQLVAPTAQRHWFGAATDVSIGIGRGTG